MNEAGRFIVQYLVNSIWQTPLLLLAAWVVSRILRKLGCVAQHRSWAAALVVAAIAPMGVFNRSTVGVHLLIAGGPLNVLAGAHQGSATAGLTHGTVRLAPAIYFTMLFAYLIFLVLAGFRLGRGLYKTRGLLRHAAAVVLSPEAAEIWQRCKTAFSLGGARLASSQEITGPVTAGTRNPVLLMPPRFLFESTWEDLAAALGHECAHLERRDFLLNLLYEFVSLPIAYHPATWMMKSRLAETRELICDRMAAERIASPRSYARSLLRLAAALDTRQLMNSHHAIGMFDANTLENRIMSLMTSQPSVSQGRKITLLASGIFLLSLSGIAAVALTTNVQEQANAGAQQAKLGGVQQPMNIPLQKTVADQTPQTYHVGGAVSGPKLVYAHDPLYPQGEKKQGVVVLGLIIDAKGLPRQVHVIRSLAPAFDKSATEAVEQYRFTPAMLRSKPVAVQVKIEVNFRRR